VEIYIYIYTGRVYLCPSQNRSCPSVILARSGRSGARGATGFLTFERRRCVPDARRDSAGTMKRRTPDGLLASCRERRESRAPRSPRWYSREFLSYRDAPRESGRCDPIEFKFENREVIRVRNCRTANSSNFYRYIVDIGPHRSLDYFVIATAVVEYRSFLLCGIVSSCLHCDDQVELRSRVWPEGSAMVNCERLYIKLLKWRIYQCIGGVVRGAGVIHHLVKRRTGGWARAPGPPAGDLCYSGMEWTFVAQALRRNMRITFYRCDRSWASIASKNESHPRVSATAARREFKVRSRSGNKKFRLCTVCNISWWNEIKSDLLLRMHFWRMRDWCVGVS